MDNSGSIYEIPERLRETTEAREDSARLDGYLRARAEADREKRRRKRKSSKKARRHGRQH